MATTEVSAASPTETDTGWARVDEFLIARGGPFYALQHRLGLLHGRALNAGRRAAILVGLAWGMPLLLSALFGHAIGPAASRPFLLDLGAWARFVVAIGIFVLMERLVEERLRPICASSYARPCSPPARCRQRPRRWCGPCAGATQLPARELVKIARGLLLL
jgi:hypothetical protein